MAEKKKWIAGSVKRPGAFTAKAKRAGMGVQQFARHVKANKERFTTRTKRQAGLARTFKKIAARQ